MSKYDQLGNHLRAQTGEWHPMTFGEIENVLGFALPNSARKYRPWWANQSDGAHVQAQAWMRAGWRVWSVNFASDRVDFRRTAANPSAGLSEGAVTPFRSQAPTADRADLLAFDRAKLSITARRILDDYLNEFGGDVQKALDRALHEARMAYRNQILDSIPRGKPSGVSSVDLIREDRDAAR
jgi:hypothetical protein